MNYSVIIYRSKIERDYDLGLYNMFTEHSGVIIVLLITFLVVCTLGFIVKNSRK